MFKVFSGVLNNTELTQENEAKINGFIFKKWISNNIYGLMFCSYINEYDLSSYSLYEYFRVIMSKRKIKFIPYPKKTKTKQDLECVMRYYNISEALALEYIEVLSDEKLKEIKENFNT